MHREHDGMKFVLVATVVAFCAACGTKRNEERCLEGLCSDPDLPFCDVDGTISGEPNACIAVDCMPGEVASCRDDRALTCNNAGTNYDLVDCPYGCDAGGCKPCNTSECEKHIIPRYVPAACDELWPGDPVTISAPATIDTTSDQNCTDVVAQPGGVDICVVRFNTLTIATNQTLTIVGTRAVALVVDRDLKVDGILDVSANAGTSGPGGGVVMSGTCVAGNGGGGAGYRTMGGSGSGPSGAGTGGLAGPSPTSLAEIRGGTRHPSNINCSAGGAGGAVTLVSCRGTISVLGTIDANGGGGGGGGNTVDPPNQVMAGGGGSGGTVVLQGMMIDATGQFYANGGGGGGFSFTCDPPPGACHFGTRGADGSRSTGTAPGGSGLGMGGRGGSGTVMPADGQGAGTTAGGGGGGSTGFFLSYTPAGVQPVISPFAASPAFLPNGTIATN
jgi:hypothetical protein